MSLTMTDIFVLVLQCVPPNNGRFLPPTLTTEKNTDNSATKINTSSQTVVHSLSHPRTQITAFFFNSLLKISFLIILCSSSAMGEIIVNNIDDNKTEIEYELNYQIHNEFEKIIEKGISIHLLEEIKIIKERDYFFDKEIYSQKNYKKIEYHPLINKYYLYDRGEKKSYLSLTEIDSTKK